MVVLAATLAIAIALQYPVMGYEDIRYVVFRVL